MKQGFKHWRIRGGFLALLFILAWSLRVTHMFFLHHEHVSTPVCDTRHEGKGIHLHDAGTHADDCSVCAFLFATPELTVQPALVTPIGGFADVAEPAYEKPGVKTACDTTSKRGPPVLLIFLPFLR